LTQGSLAHRRMSVYNREKADQQVQGVVESLMTMKVIDEQIFRRTSSAFDSFSPFQRTEGTEDSEANANDISV